MSYLDLGRPLSFPNHSPIETDDAPYEEVIGSFSRNAGIETGR